jgi:anti-sigma B factor antagonist
MPLQPCLRTENAEDFVVVKLSTSDLSEANVQTSAEELFGLVDGQPRPRLGLDLGDVHYLTSTALGKFVALHKRLRAAGGQLVLANPTDLVREIFEVSRLDQILDIRREGPAQTRLAS